jgi:hypothetical protein
MIAMLGLHRAASFRRAGKIAHPPETKAVDAKRQRPQGIVLINRTKPA